MRGDATLPPCPRSSSPAPAGSSAATSVPALLGAGHRVVALVRTRAAGDDRPRPPARRRPRPDVELRAGDVTRAGHAGAGARRRRRRRPPRGDPARLQRRRRPRAGSTRRAPARVLAAMTAAGVRRLVHMGALGVADDPRAPLRELQGPGRGGGPRLAGSTGRSSSRRSSSGRATASSTSSPGSSALSPGIVPVPGDGTSRFQPIHVGDVARGRRRARLARSVDGRRDVRARRPALLDLPRDHRGGPARARQAPRDPADAGPAHPPRGRHRRARPPAVPGRDRPAPPAPARQHRPARR